MTGSRRSVAVVARRSGMRDMGQSLLSEPAFPGTRGIPRRERPECVCSWREFSMTAPTGLNHVAMSVPSGTLTDNYRSELLEFYGGLFGWREMEAFRLP